jgi:hypothetical protein
MSVCPTAKQRFSFAKRDIMDYVLAGNYSFARLIRVGIQEYLLKEIVLDDL